MKEKNKSLTEVIKSNDIENISANLSETLLDSFLNDGVLKDIPLISTIIGLSKTGFKINDALFAKKIIYFINEIEHISNDKVNEMINEIDDSDSFKIKVGEKLLYIIDKSDDHEKSKIIGKLFKAFLEKTIDYDLFLRCSKVVERVMIDDLEYFLETNYEVLTIEDAAEYISWGVFETVPFEIYLDETNVGGYVDPSKEYKLKGGEQNAKINFVGKKLREALKN